MADRIPKKDEPVQDEAEEQAPAQSRGAVFGDEQEVPPAAREFRCSLGFDVPSGIMPHTVGDRFTQTVEGESCEFEIVEAHRNDETRRVEIVAREVKQEGAGRRRSR